MSAAQKKLKAIIAKKPTPKSIEVKAASKKVGAMKAKVGIGPKASCWTAAGPSD